jgi:alpha-amylase
MRQKFTIVLLACLTYAFSAWSQTGSEVLIQGFNWESKNAPGGWYNVVKNQAADLKASKFDMIWMPPPSDAASLDGYLPRQLYNLNSSYGTQAQLIDVINTLHNNDVKVIADIVINHRVGTTGWGDFTNPTWGCWAVTSDDEWPSSCGNMDTGAGYNAARDLDHTNQTVRNDIIAWMNWLKNTIGFDGWRYDYVKGYHGSYNQIYNNATNPIISIGELWDYLNENNPNPHRQQIVDWVNATGGTSTAFDFTTKGILQMAVNNQYNRLSLNNQPPGVIGWWPAKSVTFLDNHDTGSTQAHWPFPGNKVMIGYAYILTHPGIPMVFWDHFYDWGLKEQIKTLINIRKDNGLTSTSPLVIQQATSNLYAAIIDNKVAVKLGPGNWSPSGTGWVLKASGTDYAVWDKGSTPPPPPPSTFTVYLKRPSNWSGSSTRIHHWGALPTGSLANSTWPGVEMTPVGNGWFSFTFNNVSSSNFLFHNNAGTQTPDLNRSSEGWYMNGTWHATNPEGPINQPPVVMVNPAGPHTAQAAFTATVTATDDSGIAPTIYYTTDGSTPTTSSPSAVGSVNINVNATMTLRVFARDNQGLNSATQSHSYTINTPPPVSTFTVYFKRPANWSGTSTRIHHWGAQPTGSLANSTWPGIEMTPVGNGWFSHTFNNITSTNLLFHNNAGTQTADLNRGSEGWYMNGAWHASNPEGPINQPPVVNVNPVGPHTTTQAFTAVITATDDSGIAPTIYYTTDGSAPTTSSPNGVGTVNVSVNASMTLRFFARDNQGLNSASQSHTYTINIPVNQPPVVNVNPVGPHTTTQAFTAVITATDDSGIAPTIYYTTDGSAPTTSSANGVGTVNVPVNASMTLRFFARDNEGLNSASQSHTYTINQQPANSFTVYFQRPSAWGSNTPRIHHWGAQPTGSLANSAWPGVEMVPDGPNGWFKFTFNNVTSTNFLFHNNAGTQSPDMNRGTDGWYFNGSWSSTDPRINPPGLTVHLKTTWANPRIHYWNVQPTGAAASTTWPGVAMVNEGNGWFKFTIPNATCASIIFSNNGASQTPDLSRCGEGWYMNGTWHSSFPPGGASETMDDVFVDVVFATQLNQSVPNPCDVNTSISFSLEAQSYVHLGVYDMMGNQVAVLVNGELKQGNHDVSFNVGSLNNGIYLYRLVANGKMFSKKMVVKK